MTPIETLLALEEIKSLKARYCRLLDTKDWQGWGQLFTDAAVMDVSEDIKGAAPIHGRAAIVAQVRQVTEAARTTHHVHAPEISFSGDDAASGVWAMHDRLVWPPGAAPMPIRALTGYGHYHEVYQRQPDGWRIASLRLSRLNVEFEPLPG